MVNARHARRRLGEILVDKGLLSVDQVEKGLKRQMATGELLGEALVKLGVISENDIARTLAIQLGLPYLNAARYAIPREVVPLVPVDTCLEHRLIALDRMPSVLLVAMSGDVPADVLSEITERTGLAPRLCVSTSSQILEAIKKNSSRFLESIKSDFRLAAAT